MNLLKRFQSYQFRQINPDTLITFTNCRNRKVVSIVSIQADQSRQLLPGAYAFRQATVSIVSIQADQSRQYSMRDKWSKNLRGFNRINSGRSIPTKRIDQALNKDADVSIVSIQADQSRLQPNVVTTNYMYKFQSYQFRQINPDFSTRRKQVRIMQVSIVSIQADQSRLWC